MNEATAQVRRKVDMATRSVKPDAKALEAIRLQRGLTLEDFAQTCGLSGRTMDNVMAGEKVLVSTLARIADKLGVDVASITEGGKQEPPEGKLRLNSALPADSAPVDLLKGDDAPHRTIFYVIGKFPSGNPFWVFVAVRPDQCERFIEAHKAGTLDLYDFSSYGEIVISGTELEGYYAPRKVVTMVAKLYLINQQSLWEAVGFLPIVLDGEYFPPELQAVVDAHPGLIRGVNVDNHPPQS